MTWENLLKQARKTPSVCGDADTSPGSPGEAVSDKDELRKVCDCAIFRLPHACGGGGTRSVTEGVLFLLLSFLIPLLHTFVGDLCDGSCHGFEIVEYFAGVDSEDVEALGLEPGIAVLIVFELIALVCVAINFDDEVGGVAVEVGDEWAEGVLGSEVEVVEFLRFDRGPEFLFRRRELAAEFLGPLTRLRC